MLQYALMPYPNEHAFRINDPDKYRRIRRENDKFGQGIHVIFGITNDGKAEVQAIRFDADKFTFADAEDWIKKHNYEPIEKERASDVQATLGQLLSCSSQPAALSNMRIENGVKVYRYEKEIARTGNYVKASQGLTFGITASTLDHWVNTFKRFIEAGNKVPVPSSHANTDNYGWVVDMKRAGDSLVATIDLYGDDAPILAMTRDVSIYSPPEYIDGSGNVYIRPITHVCLCTDPVMTGLDSFKVIAASLSDNNENKNPEIRKEKKMEYKKLAELLGIKDITDENAEQLITDAVNELLNKIAAAAKEIEDLKAKAGELTKEKETIEASLKKTPPNKDLIDVTKTLRKTQIGQLVASGRITPATAKKLEEALASDDAVALSLSSGKDDGIFSSIFDALKDNDPVELKEISGRQLLSLSQFSGKEENPLEKDAERRAAAFASVKNK